jgi:lysophospholipase L1-like esterase
MGHSASGVGPRGKPAVSTPAEPLPPLTPLPAVALIGDSIRIGYAPAVAELLAGEARVLSQEPNGGDSANVLAHLDAWAIEDRPAVVHFNCGLHDLKRARAGDAYQVPLAAYEANLRRIVERLRAETGARLVFASTTPILDDRHARRGGSTPIDFNRYEADVRRYNEVALAVMAAAGVPVNDLHRVVTEAGPEAVIREDGTHYTAAGNVLLARAVADFLRPLL